MSVCGGERRKLKNAPNGKMVWRKQKFPRRRWKVTFHFSLAKLSATLFSAVTPSWLSLLNNSLADGRSQNALLNVYFMKMQSFASEKSELIFIRATLKIKVISTLMNWEWIKKVGQLFTRRIKFAVQCLLIGEETSCFSITLCPEMLSFDESILFDNLILIKCLKLQNFKI